VPILALIPIAVVSLGAVVVNSIQNSPSTNFDSTNPPPYISPPPASTTKIIIPSPIANNIPFSNQESTSSSVENREIESQISFIEAPSPSPSPSPKPTSVSVGGSGYTVLTYSLASTTVVTDSAYDDDCSNNCATKSLSQFVAENGGRAGINGTYFCPQDYSWCAGKVNSTDFPVWNNDKKKWMSPSTLFWNGRGMMVFRPGSAQFFSCAGCVGAPSDITGGIINYPSLLAGGNLVLDEGSIPANLNSKGTRSGIGDSEDDS